MTLLKASHIPDSKGQNSSVEGMHFTFTRCSLQRISIVYLVLQVNTGAGLPE